MALNKDFKVKNGLTVTESLSVGGDSQVNALTATTFEALTAKFNQTVVSTTSSLSVVNNGTGPALLVQQDGAQPIAHFIDKDGDDIIFHDDGKVSIGSRTAVEQLTVTGNISATGGIKVASTTNGFVSAGRDLADIFVTEAGGGGSVTNVRGCEGITVANGTSDACVTLDLTELPDMTQTFVDTDEFIVLDDSTQKRKAASEIGVSVFNNDSNFVCTLGDLGVSSTATELNTLSSTTFDVQTQLSQLSSIKQNTITGAATTISTSDLTADRAIISNGSGKVAVSDITNTELGFLDGVCFNIQTQLQQLSSTAEAGDITSVTAGGGIKGGGASGDVDVSIFPTQSAITSIKNTGLAIGRDDDNLIKFDTNDQIVFEVGGSDGVTFKSSGEIEATSLDIEGNVDVNGSIETDGLSLSGTNVDASATEINQIHGITDGTVAANKAVVVDVNKDISGFRNITLTGELDAGSLHTDTVTVSEFNQLSNVSFDIQTQLAQLSSSKLACDGIAANSLLLDGCNSATFESALSPSNRLSATNIGTGLITNNEFNFLDGVDANIQTQLNQLSAGAGGGGTVTSITKGDGIDGSGAITTTGTIAVDNDTVVRSCDINQTIQGKKTFTGDTTITGNLSVLGAFTCVDTAVTTTSALSVVNAGTGPALFVRQDGSEPIAHFIDKNGDDIIFADDGKICIGDSKLVLNGTTVNTTAIELNTLSSTTFDVQTQLSQLSSIKQDTIDTNNKLDATLVGTGDVTNTEFNYLNNVTSPIQTQINGINTAVGQKEDSLTPSNRLSATNIASGEVSNVEFNQLSGVTFDIQSQLQALSSNKLAKTGCAADSALLGGALPAAYQTAIGTSARIGADCVGGGTVSNAEFNQLSGVTFDVQSQLQALSSDATVVRTTGDQSIAGCKTFTDDVLVNQYIKHNGDTNTLINFTDNRIRLNAGGINFIDLEKDSSTPYPLTINNGGNRINFRVQDRNSDLLIKTNSEEFWAGLYYAGNQKLVTSNTGISVTGGISATEGLSALSITKTGGTSSQFLKADGSVDSTSYQDTITTTNRIGANCVGSCEVSNAEFNQLSSVCFNIQTQLGQLSSSKLDKNSGCAFDSARLGGALPACYQTILTPSNRLSATNIGTGIIDNTEFNYLNGLEFNIQSQLNALSSGAGGGGTVTNITAGDGLGTDGANPITGVGTINIDAAQTTITSILATDLKIGEDDQTKIDFEDADTINFYANNEKQLVLTNGQLTPGTNNDVDLGSDALEFKDGYFEGKLYADAINFDGVDVTATAVELNTLSSTTFDVQTQLQALSSNKLAKTGCAADSSLLQGNNAAYFQQALSPSNRLSATNIATGLITNTEFNYLNGVCDGIQSQIDAKEDTISASNRIGADCINSGDVSKAEFNQLSSVCFNIQTQLGQLSSSKQDNLTFGIANTNAVKIDGGSVADDQYACFTSTGLVGRSTSDVRSDIDAQQTLDSGNRLSATNIATGLITNTEFNYLNGVTSGIQSQIDAKQDTIATDARIGANCVGDNSNVSNTEYGFLDGVTSNIQTQLAALSAGSGGCSGTVTAVTGGTGIDSSGGNTPSISVDNTVVVTSGNQDIGGKKTFTDDTTITGNLSVLGAFTCIDTSITTTSALSVVNAGTGPALFVQQDGSQPIAHFIDKNGDDIIFHDDGHLSIGTCTNCETLTVKDSISASNAVKARCFVKNGGTSSQFLKADGSIDSTTYQTDIATDARIGANCVGDGTISDTEYGFLNNACFNIQTQLSQLSSSKLATTGCAADSAKLGGALPAAYQTAIGTSARIGANCVGDGTISDTEYGFLNNACFNIQSQLAALSSNKQATITGAATTIADTNLEDNRALISSSCKVAVSDITSTELGYLDGVSSNIQTQLAALSGGSGGCGGTVTSITAGSGLCGGTVTSSGTISINPVQTTLTCITNTGLKIGRDGDNLIKFATDNQIKFEVDGNDDVIFKADGLIEACTLDISGDVDVDGTLETDALSINGVLVTPTAVELNTLSSTTFDVQTQLQALSSNKLAKTGCAADSALLQGNNAAYFQQALSPSNRLSATNIGTGTVTNSDFGFLADTDSNIQDQLDAKEPIISASNRIGADCVSGGGVSNAQFNQLSGVTSSIQSQIDGKEATITGAACSITSDNLTVNRALISNGSGKVAISDITSTELGFLDGVDFNLQSQLNALSGGATGGTITGVTAGDGLIGGGTAGSVTLNVSAGDGVQVTANCVSADSTVVRTTGDQTVGGVKNFTSNVLLNNNIELRQKDSGGTERTVFELDSSNDLNVGGSYSGALKFIGGGSYTEQMRVHDDGNIGIGTTAPGEKLTVSGGISATEGLSALSITKVGGTSSQFLKADGSVDSTSYGTGTVCTLSDLSINATATEINQLDNVVVPSACFNQLSSVSSNIQTQINSKLATSGCAADSALLQGNNAAHFQTAIASDNKINADCIASGTVSNTEFNALSSVTSNIQTQINSKLATTGCAADSALLQGNNAAHFQTAIGTSARIGADCVGGGTISDAEYAFLNGVTSNIQTQLAALSAGSGGTQGTVTSITAGTGLDGGTITSTGTINIEAAQPTITSLGTLTSLTVDDITLNGSTISDSGDLTLDVGGDITLDANGADIILSDNGTNFGRFKRSSSDFIIKSESNNNDIIFKGVDNTTTITALTLDMSDAGSASFNHDVTVAGDLTVNGDFTCKNTIVTVTSALSVINTGTGPALTIQQDGTQPIAHFIDKNGDDIIFADDGALCIGDGKLTLNGTPVSRTAAQINAATSCTGTVCTLGDLSITASATEINQLDNVVVPSACFNQLSSVTSNIQTQINSKLATTGCAADSAKLGGALPAAYQTAIGTSARIGANCIGGGTVSNTEFNALSTVTSNIQTQIDSKLATSGCAADSALLQGNAASAFQDAIATDARIGADCIGGGTVSNTEFNALSTVTSNIQTQIDSKLATSGCAADSALLQGNNAAHFQTAIGTSARIGANCIASGSVSDTEFNQLSSVTSNIQTQIDSKLATSGCAADSALLQGNAASTFQTAIGTSARIGANCIGANSNISNTEYGFLNGVTSNIQTQLAALSASSAGCGSGTVTSVTAGTGMTQSGTNTINPTLNVIGGTGITANSDDIALDLDELTTSTTDGDGDFFAVVDTSGNQKKLTKGSINISGFNNDSGFTSNTGDITSVVAGNGLTGGATSGAATLNVVAGTGLCVVADAVCVDGTVVRTTGSQSIGGAKCFTSSMNATSITATGTVQAGCFVTGAFMESNAPTDKVYPQGTLLSLNENGCVVESTQEDSTMVFGVAAGDNKAPIVMGAEPVCMTGEIEVGDYITTSDCKGHGKKAVCPDFKAFGAIIGQAMESGCGDSFAIKAMIRKM